MLCCNQERKTTTQQRMMKSRVQLPPKRKAPAKKGASEAAPAGTPPEYLCAINGHVMKDPVRSKYGHCFERATIELWQQQQGQVCPLTGQPLSKEDLEAAKDLKLQIEQFHIKKVLGGFDDDPFGKGGGAEDEPTEQSVGAITLSPVSGSPSLPARAGASHPHRRHRAAPEGRYREARPYHRRHAP